MKDEILRER